MAVWPGHNSRLRVEAVFVHVARGEKNFERVSLAAQHAVCCHSFKPLLFQDCPLTTVCLQGWLCSFPKLLYCVSCRSKVVTRPGRLTVDNSYRFVTCQSLDASLSVCYHLLMTGHSLSVFVVTVYQSLDMSLSVFVVTCQSLDTSLSGFVVTCQSLDTFLSVFVVTCQSLDSPYLHVFVRSECHGQIATALCWDKILSRPQCAQCTVFVAAFISLQEQVC